MNTNALQGVSCPKCGATDAFDVEVRARAIIVDNGASEYVNPMWEDDAGTRCTHCEYTGVWHEFVADQPLSGCLGCGQTIRWNHKEWVDPDMRTHCPANEKGHLPLYLTLGELRDRTAHLPDNMPISVASEGWYNNLHLGFIPDQFPKELSDDPPSLILEQTDDLEGTQW